MLLMTIAALLQQAQTAPPPPPALPYGAPVSLAQAQKLVDKAVSAARARGFRLAIAIVEPSGELVAFARMDDTQYGSIRVAQRKAATAARYRSPTSATEARVLAGRVVILANDDILPLAGGVPIVVGDRIIGAIGVSGAQSSEDDEIARAALSAP